MIVKYDYLQNIFEGGHVGVGQALRKMQQHFELGEREGEVLLGDETDGLGHVVVDFIDVVVGDPDVQTALSVFPNALDDAGVLDRRGLLLGLVIEGADFLAERRKFAPHKVPFEHGKAIGTTLLGVLGAIVLGAGMCMVMVWDMLVWGIVVGIVGIVLLLCLIPVIKGLK